MLVTLWLFSLLHIMDIPYVTSNLGIMVANPVFAQSPARKTTNWQYQQTGNQLGGTIFQATLNSTNLIELPYPYAGGSTVTLGLRSKNGSTTVYLSVSKGMLAPSYQGGKAQIRFNEGNPVSYSLSAAANGTGNLLFIDDAPRFIRQLKTSRTMTVQLKIIGQNLDKIQFNTARLRWDH